MEKYLVEPSAGFLPDLTALRAEFAQPGRFARLQRSVYRTFLTHRLSSSSIKSNQITIQFHSNLIVEH